MALLLRLLRLLLRMSWLLLLLHLLLLHLLLLHLLLLHLLLLLRLLCRRRHGSRSSWIV